LEPAPEGRATDWGGGRGRGGYSKTGGVYVRQRSEVLRLQETEQEPKTPIETKRTNGKVSMGGRKMKNK
jgi:hypothetical protein